MKLDTHLLNDVRNLFQATIVKILAKVLTFLRLSEGGSKTESKRKYDLTTCSWVNDDQDDPRRVPTCHSKLDQGTKPTKNSRIEERLKSSK